MNILAVDCHCKLYAEKLMQKARAIESESNNEPNEYSTKWIAICNS